MNQAATFLDIYTYSNNKCLMSKSDPRTKLVFTIISISVILLSTTIATGIIMSFICFISYRKCQIPLNIIIKRSIFPLMIIATVPLFQAFSSGNTIVATFNFLGMRLSLFQEGIFEGLLMASRIFGSFNLLILLGVTTPTYQIFLSLKTMGVPEKIAEIGLLTYRYIFVLIESALDIKNAQTVRLGYSNLPLSITSFSSLAAMLFIRSFDQSKATAEAMKIRGYKGETVLQKLEKFDISKNLKAIVMMAALILAAIGVNLV